MKKLGYVLLFFLAGIFFPILIWVGLVYAATKRIRQAALERQPSRPVTEILASAGIRVASADERLAAARFDRRPITEIRGLLERMEI